MQALGKQPNEPETHILWTQVAMDVRGVGPVKGLIAVLPTEKGVIRLMGYARNQEFLEYAPTFEAIVRNATVAENLKYNPRFADTVPFISAINWGNVIVAAILGGLLALLIGFRKKKTPHM